MDFWKNDGNSSNDTESKPISKLTLLPIMISIFSLIIGAKMNVSPSLENIALAVFLIGFFAFLLTQKRSKAKAITWITSVIIIILLAYGIATRPDTENTETEDLQSTQNTPTITDSEEKYVKGLEVTIGIGECSLEVGEQMLISHSIYPSTASKYTLTWTSSNPDCVQVDDSGMIRALSVGISNISVSFTNFPDLGEKTVRVYILDTGASDNLSLHVTYNHITRNEANGKWYVFFSIDNPNNLTITETRVEAYDENGVMTYSEVLSKPISVLSNFVGYFVLDIGSPYIFRGYVVTSDGTEYKSATIIERIDP